VERRLRRPFALAAAISLAAVAATAAAPARPAAAAPNPTCSGLTSLQSLKIQPRRLADFRTQRTTIGAIASRERPGQLVHGGTAFERETYEVVAQVVLVRRTLNNAINLVLYDDGAYMTAVLPPLRCLTARTPGRQQIAAARDRFVEGCGLPSLEWEPLGAVAYVGGVGFWGPVRGRRGTARNGASLAPVTGLRFLAGCGVR
jgi:hypothetical protein